MARNNSRHHLNRRAKNIFDKPITINPNREKPKSPFARPAWFMHEDIKVISKVSGNKILNGVTNSSPHIAKNIR
jgi:hypothetical protein